MNKYILLTATSFLLAACGEKKAETTIETTTISVETLRTSVTATGTIEPVTSVTVGTQVSGKVAHLYVDYNSIVKRGQVIAELDRTNLMSELESAQANLASSKSDLEYQQANHNRFKTLYDKGLVSADEYEKSQLSYTKALNSVRTAQQQVSKAKTNLGYATITSPIDGVVLSKSVEEGQTVAASFNTPTLFTIAQDLTDMRVIADIDEADIGTVHEGQHVQFTVDAYPGETFEGRVTQVRQEAKTTSNVVTYEAVISAPNEDLKLKPGLTANVTIYTMEREGVLCVRTKALRVQPDATQFDKDIIIEDCEAPQKLWIKNNNTLKAVAVQTGAADGMNTEILSGVKSGDNIVLSINTADEMDRMPGNSNPFMPRPKSKDKTKK